MIVAGTNGFASWHRSPVIPPSQNAVTPDFTGLIVVYSGRGADIVMQSSARDIHFHEEVFLVFYLQESAICAELEFGQNS